MLQRQTLINQLYSTGDSIIEKATGHHTLHTAFHIHSAPPPHQAFQDWLREAAVASASTPIPADQPLSAEQAEQQEPGQSTRLQADNKGQHTTPKLEGYAS